MKESNYFSHDYNARSDRKMIRLQTQHGMEGVGIYWCIIEMLFEEAGYLERDYDSIAFELRNEYARIKSVIEDFELFSFDDDRFWSESCLERLKKRMELSETVRQNVNKRWDKYKGNTPVIRSNESGNTIKERKGKENKEKETKYHFDDFWNLYDKKRGKHKCESKFNRLSETDKKNIFDHVPGYKLETPDLKYRKNPETYLNSRLWEDDTPQKKVDRNEGRPTTPVWEWTPQERAKYGVTYSDFEKTEEEMQDERS